MDRGADRAAMVLFIRSVSRLELRTVVLRTAEPHVDVNTSTPGNSSKPNKI